MKNEKLLGEIGTFIKSIRMGYHTRNYINNLCNVHLFDANVDRHKEFIQVPLRIVMEYSDFDGRVDNTLLGRDLGEDLSKIEFNYLISKLKELKDNIIKDVDYENLLRIFNDIESDFEPIYFLIPIEHEYYYKIHHFVDKGIAKYENGDLVIYIMGFKVKVLWSSNQRPFNEIYLIGKDSVTWIRKKVDEMKKIPNTEHYERRFDTKDEIVSVIYGRTPENKLDFICKTVGLVEINSNKVRKYIVKK